MNLPADPFEPRGTRGQRYEATGRLLLEQLLNIHESPEIMDAIFALDEEDLRGVVVVLVASAHPSFEYSLRGVAAVELSDELRSEIEPS